MFVEHVRVFYHRNGGCPLSLTQPATGLAVRRCRGDCELKVFMEGRGGIGLGLAEPELSVQYVVAGGAASDHAGFFEVRWEEE
jgi:hypothetical protein